MLGDPATPRAGLEKDVRMLRALTAAVVSAANDVGHKFSSDFAERFSPLQIEEYVKTRGVPTFRNFQALCWQKYVDLAPSLEAAAVEKEINDVIAKLVEELVSGVRGPGGAGRGV